MPLRRSISRIRAPWQKARYSNGAKPSFTPAPPNPRAYKPASHDSKTTTQPNHGSPPESAKRILPSRTWPAKVETSTSSKPVSQSTGQGGAGVGKGAQDPRYKSTARRIVFVICAMTIAIGLTPEIWQRLYRGKERKKLEKPSEENGTEETT